MAFLANSTFILQISHSKAFKMRNTRCWNNNLIQRYSQFHFMYGSNFYESDFICICCTPNELRLLNLTLNRVQRNPGIKAGLSYNHYRISLHGHCSSLFGWHYSVFARSMQLEATCLEALPY